ncbi:MAG: hypothetical protein NZ853_08750 [Leptospiraceae bacterium]|nr:hypothetical protein [Leptospiraceae bacterium]MDW7976736.1 hypothetical protein [Leptospiraceae bacterium]
MACTLENELRSELNQNQNAIAKRLAADAIRPIDSQVVKILERKVFELYKLIEKELEKNSAKIQSWKLSI